MKENAISLMVKFGSLLWVYIAPVQDIVIGISVLVILDFITGIMASYKTKEKITSRGFRQTVSKTLSYQASVIVAMVLEKLIGPGLPIVKVVSTLIVLTEAKSFFENVEKITGIDFLGELHKKFAHIFKGKNESK